MIYTAKHLASDLTQHEIHALAASHNLADAHTHQPQSAGQREIVAQLPELWYEAEATSQRDLERRLTEGFFALHRQPSVAKLDRTMLSYSSSVATLIVAMFLRQNQMTVSLVEPCFDNLPDLLRNAGVRLSSVEESIFDDPNDVRRRLRETIHSDALFVVDPNNPTGASMLRHGRRGFDEVIGFCQESGTVLLLDLSFAAFALAPGQPGRFDIYEMLEESGVRYLAIEDTGKAWPTQDAKCALLTTSDDIWREVFAIHTSVLLNVSPFVLNVLTRYVEDAARTGLASVHEVITENRRTLGDGLSGSVLTCIEPQIDVSVAWLSIHTDAPGATDLHRTLVRAGVYTLPGTYFYWNTPSRGERFLRVALARDPKTFEASVEALRRAVDVALGSEPDRSGLCWP